MPLTSVWKVDKKFHPVGNMVIWVQLSMIQVRIQVKIKDVENNFDCRTVLKIPLIKQTSLFL